MIWFDITELEQRLKNGDLTDNDALSYLLVQLIGLSLTQYLISNDYTTEWFVVIEVGIAIAITVLGVRQTFTINSTADNKDYFKRYLSLSFVTGVRLLVFVLLAAIPVGLIVYFVENTIGLHGTLRDILTLLLKSLAGVIYYSMLTKSFKRVSQ
jgi:hypothetical protein